MKYIRTNLNEIYCLDDFTKSDIMVNCYVAKYFRRCINKNDIIKQADTIEELCDMFVFRAGEDVNIDQDNDKCFRLNWKCYDTIYGAIWTDKGLIYVAKMNEEGELELL